MMKKRYLIPAAVGGAYLLMIRPGKRRHPDDYPMRHYLYAHRGLYDNGTDAPENSLRAFQKAIEGGYGVELDIQLTRDRKIVVFHDFTLERVVRDERGNPVQGRVDDYTFAQLQKFRLMNSEERIPLFQTVLDLLDGKVPVIVEFKVETGDRKMELCPLADEILRNYHGLYCVESFNPFAVRWYRKHHPEIMRGQLAEDFTKTEKGNFAAYFSAGYLLFNFLTKPDFIAYNCIHESNLSRRLCRRIYGATSVAWTVQSQKQLKKMSDRYDLFIFEGFIPEKRV